MRGAGRDPRLHARGDVAGAGAEGGDAGVLGELPQAVHRRPAGIAVVEHDRGRRQQAADEEVPHHPAGRREPEDAVARLRVDVQVLVLELLQQDPAVALHDRLRQARSCRSCRGPTAGGRTGPARSSSGGAAGSGVAERRRAGPVVEGDGVAQRREVGLRVELAQHDRPPQRRQPPLQLGQHRAAGRTPCRRTGSRRPRAAAPARSARSGRRRRWRRSRARRSTRSRRSRRRRAASRPPPAGSRRRRRRGRPAPIPPPAARPRRAR